MAIPSGFTITDDTGTPGDLITNDNLLTLSGVADASQIVEITVTRVSGSVVVLNAEPVSVDGAGDWSYVLSSVLVDGDYTVRVVDTGDAEEATFNITVDTTVPALPTLDVATASDSGSLDDDNITSTVRPTLTGTAEANATVRIVFDGTGGNDVVRFATADGSGDWTLASGDYAADLTDDTYSVTAEAEDAAGNASGTTTPLSLTIDTVAPSAPSALDLATASDTGVSTSDNNTSDATPTITGTASANATVGIYRDGNPITTVTADGTGAWTYTAGSLADGTYAFTATEFDAAGNESAPTAALNVTVDTTAPGTTPTVASTISTDSGTSATDRITNDTTPTISGTTVNNGRVEIFLDGVSNGFATADGSGAWTYTFGALSAGVKSITVADLDTAGNAGTASSALSVTIDTTAPSTPTLAATISTDSGSSATDRITTDTTPTVSGTATANATVNVYLDGALDGTATADGSGAWTYTFGALAAGSYDVTATEVDTAGNESAATSARTIVIDTTAPSAPAAPDLAVASDTGTSTSDNITNDTTPTFTGTAEANATVTVYLNGVLAGTATADGSGDWSYTPSAQTAGLYLVTATQTDVAGNVSAASSPLAIFLDTVAGLAPPAPDLASSSDLGTSSTDDLTSDTTPTVTGTAEADATVNVYLGGTFAGTTTADGSGAWSYTFGALSAGTHVVTATQLDTAGNESAASGSVTFTLDTTVPSAPGAPDLDSGSDSGSSTTDNITNDTTPTVGGTATANATVNVYRGGTLAGTVTANGSGVWTYTFGALSEATYSITATELDTAGNESVASTALSVTIDTTNPSAPSAVDLDAASDTGSSSSDDITSETTPTVSGTAVANATVRVYLDGTLDGTTTADGSGAWSYTFGTLAAGTYTLTATQLDAAGNESVAGSSSSITVDTTAPSAPGTPDLTAGSDSGASNSDNITNDTTPTVSGTATANASVNIYSDGTLAGTATANGSGAWTYTFGALAAGTYAITATEVDTAGNESVASGSLSITVDTTAPGAAGVPDLAAGSDTGSSATDNITNDTTPTIGGVAFAGEGETITIYRDGTQVGTATADSDGDWTYDFATLAAGTYAVTATVTDLAGNVGSAGSALSLTIDTTAPSAPGIADLDDASDTGNDDADNITNDTTPTFTGTAAADAVVNVYLNGSLAGTTTADGDGDWSYTASAQTPGLYVVTATQEDAAGNESAAGSALAISIDTTAPYVLAAPGLDAGSDSGASDTDDLTNATTPTVSGTAEVGATVNVYVDGTLDGSATADSEGDWSYVVTSLSEGLHEVTATQLDEAGNESATSPALSITIDTVGPAAPTMPALDPDSETGNPSDAVTSEVDPTVTGTVAANAVVRVYLDGDVVDTFLADGDGAWSYTFSDLADGEYEVTATEFDAAANESDASEALVLTIDTTPPDAPSAPDLMAEGDSGDSDSDDLTNVTGLALQGTATADAFVYLYVDGEFAGIGQADEDGDWELTLNELGSGTYAITVTELDSANNESAASGALTVTIDADAPDAPDAIDLDADSDSGAADDDVTSDTTPLITGVAAVDATVYLYLDGEFVDEVVADAEGNWTHLFSALAAGIYTIGATQFDAAGNESAATELALTIDDIAPDVPGVPDLDDLTDSGADSDDHITDIKRPTIFGSAEALASVEVTVDGSDDNDFTFTVQADADGFWVVSSEEFEEDLATGTYAVRALAVDAAGNGSDNSEDLTLTIVSGVVDGSVDDNTLFGSDDNDALFAGDGNDTVAGGEGDDTIDGGEGLDTFSTSAFRRQTVLDEGPEEGDLALDGPEGSDVLLGVEAITYADGRIDFDTTSVAAQIHRLYEGLLGRAPDALGAAFWAAAIDDGDSLTEVADAFLRSAEFQDTNGTLDNAAFVTLLYDNALGRAPEEDGLNFWVGALDSGALTRAEVAVGITDSAEGEEHSAPTVSAGLWTVDADAAMIFGVYRVALGRSPDAEGFGFWMEQVANGFDLDALATAFAESSEFQESIASLSTEERIELLYDNAFDRAPDEDGFLFFQELIEAPSVDFGEILEIFANSQEMYDLINDIVVDGITVVA